MVRRQVRDLRSNEEIPKRFCDVIVDKGNVYLEVKQGKNDFQRISWDDVVYQVNAAKNNEK